MPKRVLPDDKQLVSMHSWCHSGCTSMVLIYIFYFSFKLSMLLHNLIGLFNCDDEGPKCTTLLRVVEGFARGNLNASSAIYVLAMWIHLTL
jgi:hypothetical protein